MSPNLTEYLQLLTLAEKHKSNSEPEAEKVYDAYMDVMDLLWWQLSRPEREAINRLMTGVSLWGSKAVAQALQKD